MESKAESEFRFRWGSQKSEPKIGIPNQEFAYKLHTSSLQALYKLRKGFVLKLVSERDWIISIYDQIFLCMKHGTELDKFGYLQAPYKLHTSSIQASASSLPFASCSPRLVVHQSLLLAPPPPYVASHCAATSSHQRAGWLLHLLLSCHLCLLASALLTPPRLLQHTRLLLCCLSPCHPLVPTTNNAKAPSSMLMPPLLLHEQRTINNAKALS